MFEAPVAKRALSQKVGIDGSLIGQYVSGAIKPGIEKCVLIAEKANISIQWLATGEGPMQVGESPMRVGESPMRVGESLEEDLARMEAKTARGGCSRRFEKRANTRFGRPMWRSMKKPR